MSCLLCFRCIKVADCVLSVVFQVYQGGCLCPVCCVSGVSRWLIVSCLLCFRCIKVADCGLSVVFQVYQGGCLWPVCCVSGVSRWLIVACLVCFRCIKVAVVPSVNVSWATKPLSELKAPKFSEVFAVTLLEHRLYTNTLQLNVWSLHDVLGDECLVSVARVTALFPYFLLLRLSFLLHFRDLCQVCESTGA